jgi:hypothetical protein
VPIAHPQELSESKLASCFSSLESEVHALVNLEASVRSSRPAIEGVRDPGTSLKPD